MAQCEEFPSPSAVAWVRFLHPVSHAGLDLRLVLVISSRVLYSLFLLDPKTAKSHLVSRLKKYKCNPILAGATEIPSIYKISTPFSLGIKALILRFLC